MGNLNHRLLGFPNRKDSSSRTILNYAKIAYSESFYALFLLSTLLDVEIAKFGLSRYDRKDREMHTKSM